jgi:hypothetical protein
VLVPEEPPPGPDGFTGFEFTPFDPLGPGDGAFSIGAKYPLTGSLHPLKIRADTARSVPRKPILNMIEIPRRVCSQERCQEFPLFLQGLSFKKMFNDFTTSNT